MSAFLGGRGVPYGNRGCGVFKQRVQNFKKLPKNQHTQRKLLNFENWVNGEVSKTAKIWLSKFWVWRMQMVADRRGGRGVKNRGNLPTSWIEGPKCGLWWFPGLNTKKYISFNSNLVYIHINLSYIFRNIILVSCCLWTRQKDIFHPDFPAVTNIDCLFSSFPHSG